MVFHVYHCEKLFFSHHGNMKIYFNREVIIYFDELSFSSFFAKKHLD